MLRTLIEQKPANHDAYTEIKTGLIRGLTVAKIRESLEKKLPKIYLRDVFYDDVSKAVSKSGLEEEYRASYVVPPIGNSHGDVYLDLQPRP